MGQIEAGRERPAEERERDRVRRALHRQSRCVMVLPPDLEGRRVLDLECRGGLGAFKIADRVGPGGFVVGVDSSAENVERAVTRAPQMHWAGPEWGRYLEFFQACAGNLAQAGIEDASFDVVVANSSLNLSEDLALALGDIRRVLSEGGFLYLDAVLATRPGAGAPLRDLRRAGNVFACAPTLPQLEAYLLAAGFARVAVADQAPLDPPEGDAAPELAGLAFTSATVQAFA